MTLQQLDSERVVGIHYHRGEQASTRCVNVSGCKQLRTQAAQDSYSGKAQHHKQGRCATISIPILDRPSLHNAASYTYNSVSY